jgi:hypothetical protein
VLNREGSSNLVSIIEAQKVLGRTVDGRLPNDFAVASAAQSQGVPFLRHAPGAALSKAYDAFATQFIAMIESPAEVQQRDAATNGAGRRSRLFGLLKR